jgi:hypothetical protein
MKSHALRSALAGLMAGSLACATAPAPTPAPQIATDEAALIPGTPSDEAKSGAEAKPP